MISVRISLIKGISLACIFINFHKNNKSGDWTR